MGSLKLFQLYIIIVERLYFKLVKQKIHIIGTN